MTPTDLSWLDITANDFTAAADTPAKTNAIWARLELVILTHSGADVATRFENSLAIQQEALNKNNAIVLTTEAKNSLELVDALEQLF